MPESDLHAYLVAKAADQEEILEAKSEEYTRICRDLMTSPKRRDEELWALIGIPSARNTGSLVDFASTPRQKGKVEAMAAFILAAQLQAAMDCGALQAVLADVIERHEGKMKRAAGMTRSEVAKVAAKGVGKNDVANERKRRSEAKP